MIDWVSIQTAIESWFETSTGISADFLNAKRPVRLKPRGFLEITDSRRVGGTELRYIENIGAPAGSEMEPAILGVQQFTLSVQVHSRSQKPGENAMFYLEKARNGLRIPSTKQILADANLSIAGTAPLVHLDTAFDNRIESRAALDIIFNTAFCETIATEAIEFMDKVEISSDTGSGGDLDDEIFGNQS